MLDTVAAQPVPETLQRRASEATEWILLTSGTTGVPKLVVHSFESLAGALPRNPASARPMVWSTFYDIRRYGGLQIYLRAVLSGSPLVLSSAGESTREFFTRAAAAGVTHISGTPSHWRRALMSGETALISPEYVRLSGEVADQTVLDNLRAAYPTARIAPCIRVDGSRRGFRRQRWTGGLSREPDRQCERRYRHENSGRHAVDPLAPQRRALSRRCPGTDRR